MEAVYLAQKGTFVGNSARRQIYRGRAKVTFHIFFTVLQNYHIESGTKWRTFANDILQMRFFNENVYIFSQI